VKGGRKNRKIAVNKSRELIKARGILGNPKKSKVKIGFGPN
jgi:hypothetical protein